MSGFKDKCATFLCDELKDGFGYFYRFEEVATFPLSVDNTPIPFNQDGPVRSLEHDKVNTPEEIKFLGTGVFEVTFFVNSGGPDYFGIELNGTVLPETIIRTRSTAGIEYMQALIRVSCPNSILRVLFLFKAPSTLARQNSAVGAPVATNTSLVIVRVGDLV
ncbi:hypothetical protein [Oceanirhabdus sp. W0125-5]|uniref:hypothetical protein n=1 Tax=Oceanirhabdus sp. W0125-5 TaxID=2999116 RepID=UPI0022F33AC6|nr:hypothetical protein [Oceanirhabdus sp. W0125-5]WBW96574.1 hypothetical protein OW730_23215 [Oceanirhabdus sp. W0125-5]